MTKDCAIDGARAAQTPELHALREKIGWICQSLRFTAVLYAAWLLYGLATYWSDAAAITKGYGRLLQRDLSGISVLQQLAGFGVNLVIWLCVAAACSCAWRLFTAYLAGSILTTEASGWLRRTAWYGVIAQLLAIATRPLVSVILTSHFRPAQNLRSINIFLQPNDLLTLLLLFTFLALAHVQMTAAHIASEHQQIV